MTRSMTAWRQSLVKNNKTGLLTICAKAGKLAIGMDMAKDSCRNGNAYAVFTASDLSDKSLKEMKYYCGRYGVKLYALGMTMDEVGDALRKRSGIITVLEKGFSQSIAKGLDSIETIESEWRS